jgi:hypothetical protein
VSSRRDAARWQQVQAVLIEALAADATARRRLLADLAMHDPALAEDVAELLAHEHATALPEHVPVVCPTMWSTPCLRARESAGS